jgi:hypothetical protein
MVRQREQIAGNVVGRCTSGGGVGVRIGHSIWVVDVVMVLAAAAGIGEGRRVLVIGEPLGMGLVVGGRAGDERLGGHGSGGGNDEGEGVGVLGTEAWAGLLRKGFFPEGNTPSFFLKKSTMSFIFYGADWLAARGCPDATFTLLVT